MSDLSQTDQNFITYLRGGRRKTSAIARQCLGTTAARPAAAHLARMKERGLVRQAAGFWELTEKVTAPSPELPL
jgi:predicted transcriptional regulator